MESSVTFMNLIISELKCPVVTRQPLGDGTYLCCSSGRVLCTPHYLHFPEDQVYFTLSSFSWRPGVQWGLFPIPLLSLLSFEATSSPAAEFLFAFPNSLNIRSDPVKDYLIYRRSFSFYLESNADPAKSAVKVSLAPWNQFIFSLISIQRHH